ncbi:MAG: hypothetical protein HEEMFOPI_02056 [Holosporales bacterium]
MLGKDNMDINVLYGEVKEFSNFLVDENFISDADKLLDCMGSGSTGTEILMCLNSNIIEIVNSKNISQKTKDFSVILLEKINYFIGDIN